MTLKNFVFPPIIPKEGKGVEDPPGIPPKSDAELRETRVEL